MGVRVLYDPVLDVAVLYCSTTEWAFGPLIGTDDEHTAVTNAALFVDSLTQDARRYTDAELETAYSKWLGSKEKK